MVQTLRVRLFSDVDLPLKKSGLSSRLKTAERVEAKVDRYFSPQRSSITFITVVCAETTIAIVAFSGSVRLRSFKTWASIPRPFVPFTFYR